MDLDGHEKDRATKILVRKTYKVTILMLIIGQLQVFVVMEIASIKEFLAFNYHISLLHFFVSFISIQLYVFFYRILEQKSKWKRTLADIWTYEVNTLSIMKPVKRAPYICLIVSSVLTFMVMGISVMYGNMATSHRRGLFMSRRNIIRWSERVFVLTCFGIILCSEMKRFSIEIPSLLIYTSMGNIPRCGNRTFTNWKESAITYSLASCTI
ncbi:uncharacterized protein LOC6561156 isoform X2 [Drosophila grimshawi]|uniref:uncharacterized protein LOC6561156 isoform X2 n=1 Tax=Drosophila grimshawi TaxID=7222 RepID=UPI000C86F833|nr:uncharacterized protein LOC6561156 isoform X2 [Drosophila grimshawi]